jgi:AraC-like DNA-binding protein
VTVATPVAALLERRTALLALRRAMPGRPQRVYTARTPSHLDALLRRHLVDAVVLGAESVRAGTFAAFREDFATIPVFCFAAIRSDDAAMVRRLERLGVEVVIEALDEPVLARRLRRSGLTARREDALLPLGDALGLSDPFQRDCWRRVIEAAPGRLATAELALRRGVSRETLSRRFVAGGAPHLKLTIDAVRLVAAGQLLGCRGYRVSEVAALLGYSSVALLQATARRLVGTGARALARRTPEEIVLGTAGSGAGRWT